MPDQLTTVSPLSSGAGGVTIATVIDTLYPVGALYISTLATNPGTLLGRGTWTAFGAGRVMVGLDATQTEFDTVEETGGAKTVAAGGTVSQPTFTGDAASLTHAGTAVADHAAHTHSVTSNVTVADHASHTHTYTQVPNHVHPITDPTHNHTQNSHSHTQASTTTATGAGSNRLGTTDTSSTAQDTGSTTATNIAAATGITGTDNPTGGVATGTTAGPSATLTHTPTNNAVTSGNPSATLTHAVTHPNAHSHTPAGTVSQPTFTGTATSVLQPFVVIHAWKRVS